MNSTDQVNLEPSNKELEQAKLRVSELEAELTEAKSELKISAMTSSIAMGELERINQVVRLFIHPPLLHRVHIHTPGTFHETEFIVEKATILFADIRSYTKQAEILTPEQCFNMLNQFFQLVEGPILDNNGYIDKFIGDEIMAVFDDPETSEEDAVKAGIEMQVIIKKLNKDFPDFFEGSTIRFGVGINTGVVMSGMLGTLKRSNLTVIGDPVNLASRVQELTKRYDADILITQNTFNKIKSDKYLVREVDTVTIRGKKEPATIYEIFETDEDEVKEKKIKTLELLKETIFLYKEKSFYKALVLIYKWLDIHPEDSIAKEYIKRCRYLDKYPPHDPNWLGVVSDTEQLVDIKIWRQEKRFDVNTDAEIIHDNQSEPLKVKLLDISFSGIRFGLNTTLPLESFFNTRFQLLDYSTQNGATDNYDFLCQSVWQKPGSEDNYYELGAEIVKVTPGQKKQLRQILQNIKDQPAKN